MTEAKLWIIFTSHSLSLSHYGVCVCVFVTACYLLSPQPPHTGWNRGIWVSSAHVQLYEEVPVWSPCGPRKWSRCKASGSHNPVGHLPCYSCTAFCKINKHTAYHLSVCRNFAIMCCCILSYTACTICELAFIVEGKLFFMQFNRTQLLLSLIQILFALKQCVASVTPTINSHGCKLLQSPMVLHSLNCYINISLWNGQRHISLLQQGSLKWENLLEDITCSTTCSKSH